MNVFEQLLWTAIVLAAVDTLEGGHPRGWLMVGAGVGVGVLNKHSMVFYACALAAALAVTRGGRQAVRSRWALGGLALAACLALPHVVWQLNNGFPMFELLRNGQASKNAPLRLMDLWKGQAMEINLAALPVLMVGAVWLVRSARASARVIGLASLGVEILFVALKGKPYYLMPLYPALFAAGGAALGGRLDRWPKLRWVLPAAIVALGAVAAPVVLPLLPVELTERYAARLGSGSPRLERMEYRVLPQHLADQFGWPEMTQSVAQVYRRLTPEEQTHVLLYGRNYGEAAALDIFGPALGLPRASSQHNNYYLWGPHGDGQVVIRLGGSEQNHRADFEDVELAGHTAPNPHGLPYEDDVPIFVLRRPKVPFDELWRRGKAYL